MFFGQEWRFSTPAPRYCYLGVHQPLVRIASVYASASAYSTLPVDKHGAQLKMYIEDMWQWYLEIAESLATREPNQHERTLFIMSVLYMLYLRITELAGSDRWVRQMKHFYQDSKKNWGFKTLGEGNKVRDIAVSDDMLNALKRYKANRNLTPLPSPPDSKPWVPNEIGHGAVTSTRHIRKLVEDCFDKTVDQLRKDRQVNAANAMELATVHWLRHTGISDDIN